MRKHKSGGINRREFVSAAIAGTVCGAVPGISPADPQRPNVLFILADDLGYGDLSCFGRPDYTTPNLDRLAQQGVRFSSAYSASPVCTPTRCAFITGRYPARVPVGLQEPLAWKKGLGDKAGVLGLSPDHPTVASLLRKNGYRTALVGKWHLGYLPTFGPIQSGFDEFFGILSGGVDYFTHKDGAGEPDLFEDKVPVERLGYITDLLTERAVRYISRRHDRPFYLSLHYTAPHWPWEGPEDKQVSSKLKGGFDGLTAGGSLKTYAAMMKSLDEGIGQVMRALGKAGRDRDTLVIFTSDNGGERFSYNWPFTGQKAELREGGIRVPAIIRWPGVIPSGRATEQVAITMDWTATILAATQTRPDPAYPLDGLDLLPVSKGGRQIDERRLFWRHGRQDAARIGKWKYLNDGTREYLFDLSADQREQADFKEQHPDVFGQLRGEFQNWQAQMLPRAVTITS
ncbi:MAG TPA: sulfatase-like hydrolase/transferase [Blastocatellia bacterium]|nr:sulfatase-like hydrolase/transferase [Blastocatellia bacterium]